MINARFHGEARLEFLDGVAYYEAIEVGLGNRFRQSVEAAIALAVSLPFAGSPYKHGTRRVFPKKFPFSIVTWSRKTKLSYSPLRTSGESRDIGEVVGMTVNWSFHRMATLLGEFQR